MATGFWTRPIWGTKLPAPPSTWVPRFTSDAELPDICPLLVPVHSYRVAQWNSYRAEGTRLSRDQVFDFLGQRGGISDGKLKALAVINGQLGVFFFVHNFWIGVGAMLLPFGIMCARDRGARNALHRLEIEAVPGEYVVDMQLSCSGREYGSDFGRVTAADGWLLFEGERTSFSLSPRDLDFARTHLLPAKTNVIQLALGPTELDLTIEIKLLQEHWPQFQAFLKDWATTRSAPCGIAVLPPLEPDGRDWHGLVYWLRTSFPVSITFGFMINGMVYGASNKNIALSTLSVLIATCVEELLRHQIVQKGRRKTFRKLEVERSRLLTLSPVLMP